MYMGNLQQNTKSRVVCVIGEVDFCMVHVQFKVISECLVGFFVLDWDE